MQLECSMSSIKTRWTKSDMIKINYKINSKIRKIMLQTKFNRVQFNTKNMLKEAIRRGKKKKAHSVTQNYEYFIACSQQHFKMSEIHIIFSS